jgi:diamine N-acetyltransferase
MSKRVINPFLKGPIRLRLLEEADLPLTLSWRNQEHIRRWFFYSDVVTPEQHLAWFKQYNPRDDDFTFVIEQVTSPGYRPVGQIALYHIDWEMLRGEYGRLMIGETDLAGKGLARAATEAILQIGFEVLGLQEIFLEVIPSNERAIRLYQTAGFQTTQMGPSSIEMNITLRGWIELKNL